MVIFALISIVAFAINLLFAFWAMHLWAIKYGRQDDVDTALLTTIPIVNIITICILSSCITKNDVIRFHSNKRDW